MEEKNFKIYNFRDDIILEKDNKYISISQAPDNDIYFRTPISNLEIELNANSIDYAELQTYIIFETLIKLIIGRYILSNDINNQYLLPDDFINLDTKTITYHSDSSDDNILKIQYKKNTILISICKCKNAKKYNSNFIRICTSGSMYQYYYQEFNFFFKNLFNLEQYLNEPKEVIIPKIDKSHKQKSLCIFKKLKTTKKDK